MSQTPLRLLVVDANALWTRQLIRAMPPTVETFSLNVQSLGLSISGSLAALGSAVRWRALGPNQWERLCLVPGWTKAYRISSAIVAHMINKTSAGGAPGRTWVVYTLPHYAHVARQIARAWPTGEIRQAYYAYDFYRGYAWDERLVAQREKELLQVCHASIAISRSLQADFQAISGKKIGYLPNAVSQDFIQAMAAPTARPTDLPRTEGGLIIGCIGQINASYEWGLIESLARLRPADTLVFIGPLIEPHPQNRQRIERVFALPNVRWLGPRPHENLCQYLQWFDICLNPLKISQFNDCRSPLRIYDYLATDKPIISTAVAEAAVHAPHLIVGANAADLAAAAEQVRCGGYTVDLAARRRYIRANTWDQRALQLLTLFENSE